MANTNYELRYFATIYRDLEEKIVYIAETLQNPQAANNLLDDEPNEGWCMMLLKTYVTEKIGDLTGLEVMATCPRSSQSKIRKRNTGNGVSFGIVDLHKEVEKNI